MSVLMNDGTTAYAGRVVALREMNGYDDSDFLVTVMEDDGTFREFVYGTTRFAFPGRADIDATPDVAAAWQAKLAQERADRERLQELVDAAMIVKGKPVRVARGRKVPIGTEGTIGWVGWQTYGYRKTLRIGIRTADGEMIFTAASNVNVVDPVHGELEPSNAR
jgi:hypothetical protein